MANGAGAKTQWTLGALLWLTALFLMASFQTWRGAFVDGAIIYALTVVLALDRLTGERSPNLSGLRNVRSVIIWGFAALAAIILTLAPRHGVAILIVMILLGVTMLALAWGGRSRREPLDTRALRRSAWIWGSIAVAFCLWEALTFVLSVTLPGGSDAHPTVSVILDPALETVLGRGFFVGIWIALGVGLVMIWKRS